MTGKLVLRAGAATDVGRMRSINQDRFVLLPDRRLWVVADGMGGHQGGEVAAQLAVDTLEVAYQDADVDALTEAIAVANHRIRQQGEADKALQGMGTTVVAAAVVPDEPDPDREGPGGEDAEGGGEGDAAEPGQHVLIANVGDSRAYLYRDDDLVQITDDHSVVADLVREGRISAEEAEHHPQRNIVTRVLGIYETVDVDLFPVDPVRGDRYLLCSDGLFNEVPTDRISAVLRRLGDPQDAASELVRLANEGGGRDNITVVVLDVVEDGGTAEAASAALAKDRSARRSEPDLAGFTTPVTTEPPGAEPDPAAAPVAAKLTRRERRAARKAARAQRTRLTWRAVIFSLLVLGVIGGAVATIQWYGTSTYFVGFDDDEVTIFKGRPGGLLWIDPELVQSTGIDRDDVPDAYLPALDAGREQPSLSAARSYVLNIRRDIAATPTPATPTTTTSEGA